MLDRPEAVKRFESPASAILARNVRVKLKDIPKATSLRGRVLPQERETNRPASVVPGESVIVPSFGTTGALFARHLSVLDKLKRRIYLLRQASVDQSDSVRAWEQIRLIYDILEDA